MHNRHTSQVANWEGFLMSKTSTRRPLTSRDLLRFYMVNDPQVSPDGTQVAWVRTWIDAERGASI
jgi:hypothetical protein